jgi:hypothetical protein
VEGLSDAAVMQIRSEIASSNMDAVPLEKAPKVAVYVPSFAPPWDDAVTMALNYAGIEYDKLWDPEVMDQGLKTYDWLHLHHEDFTGQYSKFSRLHAGAPWLAEMVSRNTRRGAQLATPTSRPEEGGGQADQRSWNGADSSSPCAPRPRRSTLRWPRRTWTSPHRTPTAPRSSLARAASWTGARRWPFRARRWN